MCVYHLWRLGFVAAVAVVAGFHCGLCRCRISLRLLPDHTVLLAGTWEGSTIRFPCGGYRCLCRVWADCHGAATVAPCAMPLHLLRRRGPRKRKTGWLLDDRMGRWWMGTRCVTGFS